MSWSRQPQIPDSPGVLALDTSMGTSSLFSFQKLQMTVVTSTGDCPSWALGLVVVVLADVLDLYSGKTTETSGVTKKSCQEKCGWLPYISMENWLLWLTVEILGTNFMNLLTLGERFTNTIHRANARLSLSHSDVFLIGRGCLQELSCKSEYVNCHKGFSDLFV